MRSGKEQSERQHICRYNADVVGHGQRRLGATGHCDRVAAVTWHAGALAVLYAHSYSAEHCLFAVHSNVTVVSLLQVHTIYAFVFPESPKYLFVHKRDEKKTLHSLRYYHGDHVDLGVMWTCALRRIYIVQIMRWNIWRRRCTTNRRRRPVISTFSGIDTCACLSSSPLSSPCQVHCFDLRR